MAFEHLQNIFKSDAFMPHGHCYLWRPEILWLNVVSDALIAVAYFVIPSFLIIFFLRRKDLEFRWIFLMFSLFIVACGSTHLMEIWTVWNPNYGIAGAIKLFTAGVSLLTTLSLWPLFPKLLALASPSQLEAANAKLKVEIAERAKAEEGWRHAKEAADVANSAKTAFLANMSHEIRTPLGAVVGFAELLITGDLGGISRTEVHHAIKRNSELLLNVINDILDLSKVEAGKIVIENKPVFLADIINDLSSTLKLQASERGVDFQIFVEADLPEVLNTDPLRLRQIILNVVGNAIKFTDSGWVRVNVAWTDETSNLISFLIEDSGIGIQPETARVLFEPFRQADVSTSRRYGGSGLGLALSKRLAAALGGDVQLTRSVPGKGSAFTVTIDAGPDGRRPQPLPVGRAHGTEEKPKEFKLDGMRVLLVDDSIDNQFLVGHALRSAGAVVETAGGGLEAIEKASAVGHLDVILMDLQMPGIDGFLATQQIRRNGFQGPIVALTAHGFSEVRERCSANGLNDHIIKPVSPDKLVQRLQIYRVKCHVSPGSVMDDLSC
jgi:signal transduction histidine kinase/CheY-like chemotaxis protein